MWTSYVASLTGLTADKDIAAPYATLMYHLDTYQFKGKMSTDVALWLVSSSSDNNNQDVEISSETMSTERMIE